MDQVFVAFTKEITLLNAGFLFAICYDEKSSDATCTWKKRNLYEFLTDKNNKVNYVRITNSDSYNNDYRKQ